MQLWSYIWLPVGQSEFHGHAEPVVVVGKPLILSYIIRTKHGHLEAKRCFWTAGELPESVLNRCDPQGTDVRERLQYAFGRQRSTTVRLRLEI